MTPCGRGGRGTDLWSWGRGFDSHPLCYRVQPWTSSSHPRTHVTKQTDLVLVKRQKGKGIPSRIVQLWRCCTTHTEPAYSLGRCPSVRSRTMACSHTATRSPGLPLNGLKTPVIHVIIWTTTHLPPRRTVYPHSGHLPTIDRAQARENRRTKTDVLTTEPRHQRGYALRSWR